VVLIAGTGFAVAQRSHRGRAAAPPGIAAGLRWSRVGGTSAILPTAIIAGGPGFIAGSWATPLSGAPLWTSPDGANWSQVPVTDQQFGSFRPEAMVSFGGRIFAAGPQQTGQRARFGVWSSTDGQIWSPAVTPAALWTASDSVMLDGHPGLGLVVSALTAGPRGLVAVGYHSDTHPDRSQPLAWSSADGRTWQAAVLSTDEPKDRPEGGRRIDGVAAIAGGFLAIEGAVTTTDHLRPGSGDFVGAAEEGPLGMLFSSDGRRWRTTPAPPIPGQGRDPRTMTVGLLKVDTGRVLAVGVDAEAREVVDRSLGAARRVVVDRPRPIVWRLRLGKGWYRLSEPLPRARNEIGLAQPAQASIRAVAAVGGQLVAVGDVTHGDVGDPPDAAVWTSADSGLTWSEPISGAGFTGLGSGSLDALAVSDAGTVVAIGVNTAGNPELWRAVPTGGG